MTVSNLMTLSVNQIDLRIKILCLSDVHGSLGASLQIHTWWDLAINVSAPTAFPTFPLHYRVGNPPLFIFLCSWGKWDRKAQCSGERLVQVKPFSLQMPRHHAGPLAQPPSINSNWDLTLVEILMHHRCALGMIGPGTEQTESCLYSLGLPPRTVLITHH